VAEEPLLTISEASQMLGVSETALRQWTDGGKVKAFVTPGGHRRYSRVELKKFMGFHPRMLGVKDLVAELEETTRQHREIAQALLEKKAWYNKLNRESQQHLAELGRRLLSLTIRYVTEPSKREETLQLVREVGHGHGDTLAKLGLPLTDSVEAFIMHRDLIMNAVAHLMKKREAFTGRIVEAIPLVAHVLDEALVALVAAHQKCRNEVNKRIEGGTAE
jgi:excisionase family DNA binding protein